MVLAEMQSPEGYVVKFLQITPLSNSGSIGKIWMLIYPCEEISFHEMSFFQRGMKLSFSISFTPALGSRINVCFEIICAYNRDRIKTQNGL